MCVCVFCLTHKPVSSKLLPLESKGPSCHFQFSIEFYSLYHQNTLQICVLLFALGILEDAGSSCSPGGVQPLHLFPCDVRDSDYSEPKVTPLSLGRSAEIKYLRIYSPLPVENGKFWLGGQKHPLYLVPCAFKEIIAVRVQTLNLPYDSSSTPSQMLTQHKFPCPS